MLKRTVVGLSLVPVLLLAVLVFPKLLTTLIAGAFCAIAAYELLGCTKLVRNPRMLLYTMVAAFCVSLWSYFGCPTAFGVFGTALFYVLLFVEHPDKSKYCTLFAVHRILSLKYHFPSDLITFLHSKTHLSLRYHNPDSHLFVLLH